MPVVLLMLGLANQAQDALKDESKQQTAAGANLSVQSQNTVHHCLHSILTVFRVLLIHQVLYVEQRLHIQRRKAN